MKYNLPWIVLCFCLLLCNATIAQDSAIINCGQKEVNDRFLRENPTAKRLHDQIEFQIADYTRKVKAGTIPQQRITAVVTLPVVVHIIHNNGSENISDAQAITAIQNLNAAYANTGFYDPSNGVNTEIQFCLAQRDPSGNATNGITRDVSPYTSMGGPQLTSDDQNVKNLNRWNPRCYINIWLVRDIPGGVVGYAYLPSAHGSNLDGIVMEAGYFGSSPANDVVIIHEMGHYLGLYHTFDGGCGNTDCTTQGDRVCDTPPDQSTGWAACNTSVNSCSTDALSGFSTDVNDLKEDYMDYGNWNCMKVFTQGQKDRMIWHINNVRSSLLNCNSCLSPCPAPVTANFTQSGTNVPYGGTVNFTNTSTNASGYRWYVNGVLQSTATNFSYTFNAGGTFNIRMVALPGSALCDSVVKAGTVNVVCTAPVTGNFTSSANNVPIGTTVNFTNTSVNASTYRWYINGVFQSATTNFSNTFNSGGIYVVRLAAMSNSPICDSSVIQDTIRVDCPVVPNFSPLISTYNVHQSVTFTNSSTGATSYIWKINDVLQGNTTNFSYSFTAAGNYSVKLLAISGTCTDSVVGSVVIEDTCVRNTFQKSIGGPADDLAFDVQSAFDGGYVLAGRTKSYGSGGDDGFIVKVDDKGTPQWSKAYGGTGNDWFNSIITTNDGGFAAVGRTYSYGNAQGDAWFVKADANGVVQWSRRFDANTANGEEGFVLVQTPDGGYAFTASYNAAPSVVDILLIKLDANGNLLWSKIYASGSTEGAHAIISDGNDLVLGAYTRTNSSWHDGLLIKVNGSNGNEIWTKKYDVDGRNNGIWQVHKQGNGYLVQIASGVDFTVLNRGRNIVMNVDVNGNVTSVKEIIAPDYMTGSSMLVPMGDGSFVTVHNEQNSPPDFNIFRIGANGTTQWAKRYPRAGDQVNRMIRPSRDGGFISAGYTGTAGNYDIYFLKTDVEGNSPGCDVTPLTVTTTTPPHSVSDFSWTISNGNFSNMVINQVITVDASVLENSLCSGTSCQEPEPPSDGDTCNQKSSFQKRYGGTGEDVSMNLVATKDGGSLVVGHSNSSGAGNKDGYAIKYDKLGKVIWAKTYGGANEDILLKAKQTTDGGYIFGGFTRSYGNAAGDAWMVKTDTDGNLQWSRRYGDGNPDGTSLIDLLQTSDGGYAFCGNHKNRNGVVDIMVVRTDATGTVLWSRGWGTDGSDESLGLTEDRDSLVVSAIYQSPTYYDAVLMKLNKTNGDIAWLKSWDFDNRANRLAWVFFQADGYLITGVNSDGFGILNPYHSVVKTDHNGNIIYTKELRVTPTVTNGYFSPTKDGGFVIETIESVFNTTSDIYLSKSDKTGNVQWTRRFQNPGLQSYGGVMQTSDGVYVAAGTTNVGGNTDVLLIRTDTSGNTVGCNSTLVSSNMRDPVITPLNFSWPRSFNIQFNANTTVNPQVADAVVTEVSQCENIPCVQPPDDDTCTTRKSFVVSIGGNGQDEALHVINTPDGGNLVVGSSNSNPGSNTDALIVKTDNAGKVIWSKTYGGAGADEFRRIIPTRDGNYVAIGSGIFKTGHSSDIFIIKIDPLGNVIWSKAYGSGYLAGEIANSVVETADGGFAIAAVYNNVPVDCKPLFLKLDKNGVLLWSKLLDGNLIGRAMDIIADGDVLIATGWLWRTTVQGHTDGFITKLQNSDGAILWTRIIESENRDNILQQLKLYNNELIVTMYNSDDWYNDNCIPVIFKTDTSGNIKSASRFNPGNLTRNRILLTSEVTKQGEMVTAISDPFSSTLGYMVKTNANGTQAWSKGYMPMPKPELRSIAAGSSGYTTVGRVGDVSNADILLMKVTADGLVKNVATEADCASTTDIPNNFENALVVSTSSNYWTNVGTGSLEMINAVPNIISSLLPSQVHCIDSTHCEIPPVDDDTCATTFQKTYIANGGYNAFYINTTSDGGSVIAGTGNPVARDETPESANIDAFVMKLAKTGKLQWAKRFGGTGYDEFRKIRQTSDGGYIAIGSSSSFSASRGIYLVRISPAGNVIWSKNYSANAANRDLGLDVIQTSDGGFVFTATNDAAPPQAHGIVAKTDANGNITWHKRLYRDEGVDIHSVIEVGDTLVLGADYWVNAEQRYYGAIIKMHKSNGNILQSVGFSAGAKGSFATHVFKTATGYLAGVHLITGASYNDKQQGIIHFGPGLELEKAERIISTDINPWSDITPTLDSGYIGTAGRYAMGHGFFLNKVNKGGTFDFTQRFGDNLSDIMQTGANAQQYPDGRFISVNTYNEPVTGWDGKLHVIKTDRAGETQGCVNSSTNQNKEDLTGTVNPVTFTDNTTFNYSPATSVTSTVSDVEMQVSELCESNCSIDSLIGPDSVCNFTDTITYELKRFGVCTQPVEWTIDTNYARIVSITDSTIRLLFKQTGTVRLRGVVTTSCEIYTDSIDIHIFDSPDTLNLGPDIAICKISTWPLNARSGFKSYLWQDGSMDSTFTADQPGIYHVTVTDYCGNQLRDTVVITLAPDVPFDLGPDISICNEDTVTLTAPTGFTNYYWSPAYRVNNSYTRIIKVNPDRDTTYTVVAERGPGCLVSDTIRVKVNRPTPLDLGIDQAFCRNDSVLLDAGPSFSDYLWNNNLTTQQIYARTGGSYHVTATDINGCISKDTVDIVMNELPEVNLSGDTIICRNSGVLFNPGIGNAFNTYLWQDGSTNNTYFGTQAGTYWVEVTNADNCKNSDTVKIIRVTELPSNFLADTVGICDGEQIELRAGRSFVSYQWDGLFNTPTITVKDESGHVLKVTDEYGCTGEDTIRVYFKFCRKRIWFPNAFTPNNDAHNSTFKPTVDGGLVKFHLTIYNRWGQKIFETQDAKRGWDGAVSGHTQDTNTFVWVCTYKFIGRDQVEKTEKGVVILVR